MQDSIDNIIVYISTKPFSSLKEIVILLPTNEQVNKVSLTQIYYAVISKFLNSFRSLQKQVLKIDELLSLYELIL